MTEEQCNFEINLNILDYITKLDLRTIKNAKSLPKREKKQQTFFHPEFNEKVMNGK